MKLGLFTACLPRDGLAEIVEDADAAGFGAVEVAAWPSDSDGPTHLDAAHLTPDDTERLRAEFAQHDFTLSALAYYANPLHPDPEWRRRVRRHLDACLDAAQRLGGAPVGTFVGRDPTRDVAGNMAEIEAYFPNSWSARASAASR